MLGLALAKRLWLDQLGSSASAEMAMVTGVTVAALFMGMSQFSSTMNRRFDSVASNPDMQTLEDLEEEDGDADARRVAERERNRLRFEKARKAHQELEASAKLTTN